ncbi:Thioredoxin [Candidatus Magnetomoraceae bacterium gMMP-15]
MKIKVLGPGCAKCTKTEKIVKKIVQETGVKANVEKVIDMLEIAKYKVLSTPAVVVDGEVKSTGKVPSKADILKWIKK